MSCSPCDESDMVHPDQAQPCSIPDRDIGGGETLEDIQHIELFHDWPGGSPVLHGDAAGDQGHRAGSKAGTRVEADPVTLAFAQAGLSQFSVLSTNLQRLISRVTMGFAPWCGRLPMRPRKAPGCSFWRR